MGKSGLPEGVKSVIYWALGIGIVALILLIMLVLFGNLSGNVGFAASTTGYNNTQNVINNYSASAVNTSAQLPVVGTILGVAILLVILLGVLIYAIRKLMGVTQAAGGSSNGNFA